MNFDRNKKTEMISFLSFYLLIKQDRYFASFAKRLLSRLALFL